MDRMNGSFFSLSNIGYRNIYICFVLVGPSLVDVFVPCTSEGRDACQGHAIFLNRQIVSPPRVLRRRGLVADRVFVCLFVCTLELDSHN